MKFFRGSSARTLALISVISLILSACQTTSVYTSDVLKRSEDSVRILVMPLDVELSELSLGGAASIRADWTEAANNHLEDSLAEFLAKRKVEIVAYETPEGDPDITSYDEQLVKLFGVVGQSISAHQFVPAFALPSKKEQFEWSMGDTVNALADRYNAEYALFITVKDSYASAERAAAIAVAAILFGVGLQGGVQHGASALVDLRTGEFAWFNRLLRGAGDIRTAKPAKETMAVLMEEFPK